jgi:hypothetical protein
MKIDPITQRAIEQAEQAGRDLLEIGKEHGAEAMQLANDVHEIIGFETLEAAQGRRTAKTLAENVRTYLDGLAWGEARIAKKAARAAMRRALLGVAQIIIGAATGLPGLLAAKLPQ